MLILSGHKAAVRCLSYSPDGRYLASGSEDHMARLWDLSSGGSHTASRQHDSSVEALAFAPQGQTLLTGTAEGQVQAWDLGSPHPRVATTNHGQSVRSLCFVSDLGDGDMLVTVGWEKHMRMWAYPTLEPRFLVQDVSPCDVLSWEPRLRTLAVSKTNGCVLLYDLDRKNIRHTFGSLRSVCSLAWSPDGRRLASGHADGAIWLARIPIDKDAIQLAGHTWTVYSLAFTPDGRTLISGSADGTVRLWNVQTGQQRHCYRWHTSWVTCVAIAPDGMTAAAGSADSTIVVWDLDE